MQTENGIKKSLRQKIVCQLIFQSLKNGTNGKISSFCYYTAINFAAQLLLPISRYSI